MRTLRKDSRHFNHNFQVNKIFDSKPIYASAATASLHLVRPAAKSLQLSHYLVLLLLVVFFVLRLVLSTLSSLLFTS